jgi:tetratricopeptide (TPR) repeat protein
MSINVPEFFGRLEGGIKDLEFLVKIYEKSPDKVSKDIIVSGYDYLGKGYQKSGDNQKAKFAWEKVIELAPGTDLSANAEENIKKIQPTETRPQPTEEKQPEGPSIARLKEKLEKEPNNSGLLIELGKTYIDAENYGEAENVLKQAIKIDSSSVNTYKLLALALGGIAGKGYDKGIYENTNIRANIAFEVMRVLDKAVSLAPNDVELRLSRGTVGVSMPFFVGKLDQGIDDLNIVAKSNVSDSIKADALYWLGVAYQKKSMSYWTKVVTQYSDANVSKMVFEKMRPSIKHIDLSKYQTPIVVVEFILGFRDELPPQTAVWIEDKNDKFIKTIYVSGFSGNAKEKQVNLPKWAGSSKFVDVDAVTGASIDLGHHIYVWDLKDDSGKKVKPGEYVIKVEVCYWPSMKYQLTTADIQLGNKDSKTLVEEGNLIPYLEVKYIRRVQ